MVLFEGQKKAARGGRVVTSLRKCMSIGFRSPAAGSEIFRAREVWGRWGGLKRAFRMVDGLSMSNAAPTLCFHCGLAAGDPPRLNRLEDGRVCQACADRLLALLPPALPSYDPARDSVLSDAESSEPEYGPDYDEPA